MRPQATLGSAWVPVAVAVAASVVDHADSEHHGQPLCAGSGLMELSLHAISSRKQVLRPRATLGIPVPVAVAVAASGVNYVNSEHHGQPLFAGSGLTVFESACNTMQEAGFETMGNPG